MTAWLLLALVVGLALPVQTGINAQLRTHLGSPLMAALVSFAVGTLALVAAAVASRAPLPASAPKSTALITEPASVAISRMSRNTDLRASASAADTIFFSSKRPSPSCIFSATV